MINISLDTEKRACSLVIDNQVVPFDSLYFSKYYDSYEEKDRLNFSYVSTVKSDLTGLEEMKQYTLPQHMDHMESSINKNGLLESVCVDKDLVVKELAKFLTERTD